MRQSPGPNALVEPGARVSVTIAKRPPVLVPPQPPQRTCTAPRIEGLSYDRAKQLLAERGLQGRVRGTYGENSDIVYRQDPKPGAQFPCDQPITFDLGTIG